ncbi:uncharacterized protein LOC129749250 [Uranotaenia lowii]|uniref:uncharacterized protein LOC129749250 n=1 Tax=Uranotaenia lowii TaxID=190385 RepID=UPI00247965A0|nr:uncharacterized protein LOC129749250 [Uranotaenia lowii]
MSIRKPKTENGTWENRLSMSVLLLISALVSIKLCVLAEGLPNPANSDVLSSVANHESQDNDEVLRAKHKLEEYFGRVPGKESSTITTPSTAKPASIRSNRHSGAVNANRTASNEFYHRLVGLRTPPQTGGNYNLYEPLDWGADGEDALLEAIREDILKTRIQTSGEQKDNLECILGQAHNYLAHWLNRNGTINTQNRRLRKNYLDLSNSGSFNIGHEIRNFLRPSVSRQLVFLSLAYSGLNMIPAFELSLVNDTLLFFSLMGNALNPLNLPALHNLRVLDLRNCGLSILNINVFSNTPSLVKLFLAHNNLCRLNAGHFTGLSRLRHLDLSYIGSSVVPRYSTDIQTDPYSSLTEGLDLSEDVFLPLTNLSFLDISHTKLLPSSSRAFRNVAVEQLSLCYTGIAIIVGSMFNGALQVLDISGNPGITTAIHHDSNGSRAFNFNLEILVCENSTVKHLDWLHRMVSLKVLLLSSNNINQLRNDTFANLVDLEILDLRNNHVSNWHQRVFEYNADLFILDLSDNNINVLTTEMLYDFASVDFLAIGNNNFVCHCLLREFVELAAQNSQSISCLLNMMINNSQSTSPGIRGGTTESGIENEMNMEIVTSSTSAESEANTSTIAKLKGKKTTTLDPTEEYTTEEYTTEEYLTTPAQHLHKSSNEYDVLFRVVHSYVSSIYDSSMKFQKSLEKYTKQPAVRVYRKNIEARFQSGLIPVNCSGYATEDPDEQQSTGQDDSETNDLVGPLNGLHIQIIDYDEERYKCIDLEDAEFDLFEQERCTLDRTFLNNLGLGTGYNPTTANIIKFSLIFFGFALLAIIIYISKWEHVKYFCIIVKNATILSMMRQKNESLLRKESLNTVTTGYMYDVFVSYSEQDRQWVLDELLPNVEKTEDISVCLHERDFKVGISILENIISSMDKSRALLLVISESFILSQWCQFEMHLAQHRLLETRREQLILVLLEDIPRSKRPKTLHYLMKTKTYIIWPGATGDDSTKKSKPGSETTKKQKKLASRREKDAQLLAEERKLFWKRLRKAINDSATAWEPDTGCRSHHDSEKRDGCGSMESTA